MRFFIGGPRILGHRTGISFGPEDFRRLSRQSSTAAFRRPSAFIYVIRKSISGHVKVGIGADPRERLRNLQTGSSERLELVYACAVRSNDGNQVELAAHDLMRNHRLVGEWFDTSATMAVAAIAASSHSLGDPVVEIPVDKIDEVLAIAAMHDASINTNKRPLWQMLVGCSAAIILGVLVALMIQVMIIIAKG